MSSFEVDLDVLVVRVVVRDLERCALRGRLVVDAAPCLEDDAGDEAFVVVGLVECSF